MEAYNLMEPAVQAPAKRQRKRAAKPSEGEPAVEKKSHKADTGFRLKGKYLFLTYPRTGGDKEVLLCHLQAVLQKWNLLKWVICQEHHAGNEEGFPDLSDVGDEHLNVTDEHFHCYLELEKSVDISSPTRLDFDGRHGDYKCTRCRYAAIQYCLKEDPAPLITEGWDVQEEISKGKRAGSIKGYSKGALNQQILAGEVTDEWLLKAMEDKILNPTKFKTIREARDYVLKVKELNEAGEKKRVKRFFVEDRRPWIDALCYRFRCLVDFTLPEELWRTMPSIFWFWGANCVGKSYMGSHQYDLEGKLIPCYEPCAKNEDWSNYAGEQIIVFNEFGGSRTPKDLIRMTEGAQQNCKYGKTITLPRDIIIILTSNQHPTFVFKSFLADAANESNWKAFLQRCQIVEITGRNPDMPASREPIVSGPVEQSHDWHALTIQEKKQLEEKNAQLVKERDVLPALMADEVLEERRVEVMLPLVEEPRAQEDEFDFLLPSPRVEEIEDPLDHLE